MVQSAAPDEWRPVRASKIAWWTLSAPVVSGAPSRSTGCVASRSRPALRPPGTDGKTEPQRLAGVGVDLRLNVALFGDDREFGYVPSRRPRHGSGRSRRPRPQPRSGRAGAQALPSRRRSGGTVPSSRRTRTGSRRGAAGATRDRRVPSQTTNPSTLLCARLSKRVRQTGARPVRVRPCTPALYIEVSTTGSDGTRRSALEDCASRCGTRRPAVPVEQVGVRVGRVLSATVGVIG